MNWYHTNFNDILIYTRSSLKQIINTYLRVTYYEFKSGAQKVDAIKINNGRVKNVLCFETRRCNGGWAKIGNQHLNA